MAEIKEVKDLNALTGMRDAALLQGRWRGVFIGERRKDVGGHVGTECLVIKGRHVDVCDARLHLYSRVVLMGVLPAQVGVAHRCRRVSVVSVVGTVLRIACGRECEHISVRGRGIKDLETGKFHALAPSGV